VNEDTFWLYNPLRLEVYTCAICSTDATPYDAIPVPFMGWNRVVHLGACLVEWNRQIAGLDEWCNPEQGDERIVEVCLPNTA
jgi:hypothetical protein